MAPKRKYVSFRLRDKDDYVVYANVSHIYENIEFFKRLKVIPPPLPIKTYQWEDIRRLKVQGRYPWTHLQKRPFDEKTWQKYKDHEHEYEPVIPMSSQHQTPPPTVRVTDADSPDGVKADSLVGSDISSIESHERAFLRMAQEDHEAGYEDHDDEDQEPDDAHLTAKELQTRLEERFFTSTPTTTGSRTDGEIHTSQVDSSALEDLPLTRDARRPATLQQRLKSQAGRIRTKFRTMSRKPKPHSEGESSEPSEHQPEKHRFTFPRRPKINFPERPKFNFPERPKFSLPERPKFNLPSRPKISMPSMPSLTRQKSASTRRPLKEKPPAAQSSGARKMFDFDFKTYPRIFSKRKKELNARGKATRAETPPPRMESESAPATPLRRKSSFGTKWTHRYTDIKFADEDDKSERCESRFISLKGSDDSLTGFKDSDFPDVVTVDESPVSNRREECQSSFQESESPDHDPRLRGGVLEEIDADEFFLRQKGLSRDNVDVSNFLTREIRDALQHRNALARLDTEVDVETYEDKPEAEGSKPTAPQRTRSLRRSSRSNKSQSVEQGEEDKSNFFNTFPPDRPQRRRSGTATSQRDRDKSSVDSVEMRNLEDARRVSVFDDDAYSEKVSLKSGQDYYSSPKEHIPPLPPKRKRSSRDITQDNDSLDEERYNLNGWANRSPDQDKAPSRETAMDEIHLENVDQNQYDLPPNVPRRRTRSRGTSLVDEDRTSREAESLPSERTEEFPPENDIRDAMYGYATVEKSAKTDKPDKPPRPPPPGRQKKRFRNIKSQGFSYFFTVPRRRQSNLTQQYQQYICSTPPVRPYRNYSTIGPSRPPRRNKVFREPVYADGDEKENKVKTLEDEELERDIEELIKNAINDQLNDNLKSGDVIEKMKVRPLPPPPRPPRRTREEGDYDDTRNEEGNVELHLRSLNASPEPVVEQECIAKHDTVSIEENSRISTAQNDLNKTKSLEMITDSQRQSRPSTISRRAPSRRNSATKRSKTPLPQDRAPTEEAQEVKIEDVSVSTQTDVLPEGYIIEEERMADDRSQTDSSYPTTTATLTGSDSGAAALVERKVILLPDKELEVEILKTKKIQVSEIDVEKLNVTEINTNKIKVSDVDGVSMHVAEINSKSGNIVINNLELPQSVLESISRNLAELQSTSAGTSGSEVPESMLRLSRGQSSPTGGLEGESSSVVPIPGSHRVLSTGLSSEEGAISLPPRQDPTVYELSQQMFDIIQRNVSKFVERSIQNGIIDVEKQREIQHTISIVLIVVAVLYLIGFGSGSTIHTHHWDFQFPPPPPPQGSHP
nr:PREDICTED: uncharacterized protein LOC109034888 isoform X2 [Bemisia tabaci]